MNPEAALDASVDTASRIGRGYLNGTTRSNGYGILLVTATLGAAAGVAGTVFYVKKNFVLLSKQPPSADA